MIEITSEEELQELITNSKQLVVDFYATWCRPCVKLGEYLNSIKDQDKYVHYVFCKVNVDDENLSSIVSSHNIVSLPHVEFYTESKLKHSVSGFDQNKINNYLNSLSE